MPNHITNRIKLSGSQSQIDKMLDVIKSDEFGIGTIDFNKITPMPERLNVEAGSRTDRGLKAYQDFVAVYTLGDNFNMDTLKNIPPDKEQVFLKMRPDINPDEFSIGRQAFQNIREYGSPTWYDWANRNDTWNTKWNAYGYNKDNDYSQNGELWFQTAWDAPHPISQKLSEMNPDITLEHRWADEDIGTNCGSRTYLAGHVIDEYFPDYGKRSMDFAAEVLETDLLNYGLVLNTTGTDYVYCDGDELQVIELFDKPALFSNERISANQIPNGLYRYDLRESDDGNRFCSIEPSVIVNHGGTVVTDYEIDFGGEDHISFTDETEPNFTGEEMTMGQYLRNEFEEAEIMGGQTL